MCLDKKTLLSNVWTNYTVRRNSTDENVGVPTYNKVGRVWGFSLYQRLLCPRWDSNPYCDDFKSSASAIGLRGLHL